jgi:hypothetical protein
MESIERIISEVPQELQRGGKWGSFPHAPAMQGSPTDRIFIPNIYYHFLRAVTGG